ncbi:AAA domain-containing protein [Hazenella coriacea]|uniref:AAA domain-containing protein n=1 Tax=Hazenella coriacea TaxID=1179467 RepID=A0A4R3L734_9BACL|nr:AAA domain-containing protein [Hazenella coriacea]
MSRIFRCLEMQELHKDFYTPQFDIELDHGRIINQENIKEMSNLKIRVYNTDFVKSNLNWLNNEDGKIKSFAILGKGNVEIKNKLDLLHQELGSINEKKVFYMKKMI